MANTNGKGSSSSSRATKARSTAKKPAARSSAKQATTPETELQSSDDVRSGYLTGPGVDHLPVRYSVVDGQAIFDGDIDMGSVDEVEADAAATRTARAEALSDVLHADEPDGSADTELVLQGVGLPTNSSMLWPNGVVPYTIASSLQNPGRVTQAIAHLQANSPIRLVPRTNQRNYVEFIGSSGNSSPIGMRGGKQTIKLSSGSPVGTVVHEILHSIGIYHEQSRSDRDTFVDIKWQNIESGKEHNFQTVPGSVDYFDYDYGSIMHYPEWAFSKNSQDTIVPRRRGVTIGQREALSWTDRQTIAKLYERFFTNGYSGVWAPGSGAYALWVNATWDSFKAKWEQWNGQGLRLHDIHVRRVGNQNRYSGVFLPGTGGYALWVNASFASFTAKHAEWVQQGLRLVSLHVHRQGNENRYSGVFLPGSGGWGLWVNASWASFKAKWQEWSGNGLRLVDIHVHKVNGQNRYSGVFAAGTGGYGLWANASWSGFVAKWKEWSAQGLRLVDLNIHRDNGQNRYTGVFRQGTGGYYLWANVTWEGFRAKWQELAGQGLRLVDYEFPAPEVGGIFSSADAGLEGEQEMQDPGLDDDGFGGLFDAEELPAQAVASSGEGQGGLVADQSTAAPLTVSDIAGDGAVELPETVPDEGEPVVAVIGSGG